MVNDSICFIVRHLHRCCSCHLSALLSLVCLAKPGSFKLKGYFVKNASILLVRTLPDLINYHIFYTDTMQYCLIFYMPPFDTGMEEVEDRNNVFFLNSQHMAWYLKPSKQKSTILGWWSSAKWSYTNWGPSRETWWELNGWGLSLH